jgi:hypothetical protein
MSAVMFEGVILIFLLLYRHSSDIWRRSIWIRRKHTTMRLTGPFTSQRYVYIESSMNLGYRMVLMKCCGLGYPAPEEWRRLWRVCMYICREDSSR